MSLSNVSRLTTFSILTALLSGCQSIQLENHTLRQAKTLTDMQYRLVLDNLALLACNPAALPYFSAAGTGTTNIQQSAQASFGPSVDLLLNPAKTAYRYYADKYGYGLQGSQTNLEQWSTASILNPDELDLMRCVYQKSLGYACYKEGELSAYFASKPELLAAMHKGWLCVGAPGVKPPHEAAYWGRYRDQYVWVLPGGLESLTRVTLSILDLATAIPSGSTSPRVDPYGALLKDYQDKATALSQILDKYPDKTTPVAKMIKDQLDVLLTKIVLIETQQAKGGTQQAREEAKQKALAALGPVRNPNVVAMGPEDQARQRRAEDLVATAEGELNSEVSNVSIGAAQQAVAGPAWRPRKNLYNPTVIPLGTNFP